jgi:tetratricopeptide (TPR) repeat protein
MLAKKTFLVFLILVTTFLVYSPSLRNGFIWDDNHLIVNDQFIRSFKNTPRIFQSHLFPEVGGSNFYRPLQTLSFMMDYAIWGLNPFGYHLTNLIFHMLSVLLVCFLAGRIFGDSDAGLLAGLIFAVHPINTEAVTYIAGRADPMSAFFFMAALGMYMRHREGRDKTASLILSITLFIMALLTKEAVLVFPLVLILYDALILNQDHISLKAVGNYIPYLLVLVIYAVFRLFIKGVPLGFAGQLPLHVYVFTISKVIVLYLGILIFPLTLHMERIQLFEPYIGQPQVIFSLIVLALIIILSVFAYRRSKKIFFFISFFFITLMPMLNLTFLNAVMAEHWLYLPAVGLYSLAAFGAVRSRPPMKKFIMIIAVLFLGFCVIRTTLRNIEWGNEIQFYKDMLRHSPYSARGHVNMGGIYIAKNNLKLAREELETASRLNPLDPFSYHMLGIVDYEEGKKKDAMKHWKQALDIAPFHRATIFAANICLYSDNKRFRRLLRTVREHPKCVMANYRLSKIYIENGLYMEALDRLESLLKTDPEYTDALFNRAWIYSRIGMWRKAIKEYESLLTLTPHDPDIYRNLGYCYAAINQPNKAATMWKKALHP